ncbi:MAG: hypothetical protein KAR79_03670 [Simkaniaceae bacterium]|nr:hypothetical protein [Simkaniaceae bacterium]
MQQTIALFGAAEKGAYASLLFINSVAQLSDFLGNPPEDSKGIFLAIQTLLYDYRLIYIRVEEEGFSSKDYLQGMALLQITRQIKNLTAICIPGVGDKKIIDASEPVCSHFQSLLITTEHDLYDYITSADYIN